MAYAGSYSQFASPSVDMPYLQTQHGIRLSSSLAQPPVTFTAQPNLGGLGILEQNPGSAIYYRNMVSWSLSQSPRCRAVEADERESSE